jgi:hypothetical protein
MRPGNDFMKTSTSALLPVIATTCALGGCEWIAGIESTTIGLDAMRPADAALPADADLTIPDADLTIPDASNDCPGPCIEDDAFEDFDALQGGGNGRWRYVEVQPDGYVDMIPTAVNGFPGFLGTGTPQPSLAYCAAADEPPCHELTEVLALTTTEPGAHHPALLWTAPYSGAYSVSVVFGTASDAPAVLTTVMLTHNDQSNVLDSMTLTDVTGFLYAEPALEAGDVVVLSAIAETDTSVSVGVNVVIMGPY